MYPRRARESVGLGLFLVRGMIMGDQLALPSRAQLIFVAGLANAAGEQA